MRKIQYKGSSKIILRICEVLNYLLDNSGVEITPLVTSGTKIAEYVINDVPGALYSPSGGGASPLYYDQDGYICIDYDMLEVRENAP